MIALMTLPDWSPETWGAIGTWIGSLATAAALLAAILAFRGARDLYEIEVERDKDRWKAERQSQASSIAGWVSPRVAGDKPAFLYVVRNASVLPIYDVEVEFWIDGAMLGPLRYPVLPPGDDVKPLLEEMLIGDDEEPWTWSRWSYGQLVHMRLALQFTDCSGLKWRRDEAGVLSGLMAVSKMHDASRLLVDIA